MSQNETLIEANVAFQETDNMAHATFRERLLQFGAPLLAAVALTACLQEAPAYTGPLAGLKVGLIGDSQEYQAENGNALTTTHVRITDQLKTGGFQESFTAWIGSSTKDLVSGNVHTGTYDNYFTGWPTAPDIAVAVEGTNDMRTLNGSSTPVVPFSEASTNYDSYLKNTGAKCDVLVGIVETAGVDWNLNVAGPQWNQFLSDEAVSRNGVYIDWANIVRQHPEYLRDDLVHQTNAGQIAFRGVQLAGIAACAQKINAAAGK